VEQGRQADRDLHVQRGEEEGVRRGIQVAQRLPQVIRSVYLYYLQPSSSQISKETVTNRNIIIYTILEEYLLL
jgi:hypothetical protein